MALKPSRPFVITKAAQVRALASPARQELIDALAAEPGPSLVADLAEVLGRRPDALYYHLRALEKAGLVTTPGTARTGRRPGAVYDVPGRPVAIRYNAADKALCAALAATTRGMTRLAARDFKRALGSGVTVGDGPLRNIWGARRKGWLNDADLPRINELIRELMACFDRGKRTPDCRPHAAVLVMTPLPDPKSSRSAKTSSPRRARTSSGAKKGAT